MAIPADKHRYSVMLTPANVARFKGLCKDLGLPSVTMSLAFDDLLVSMADMFQETKDRGSFSMADLFNLLGKQIKEIEEEDRKRDPEQKRAAASRKKRA